MCSAKVSFRVAMFVICSVSVPFAVKMPAGEVIDVGDRKQLFMDDRFIESSSDVVLTVNPPRRDGNIVLQMDQPWEQGRFVGVYSSVLQEHGLIRLWYDFRSSTPDGVYEFEDRVAYAESKDGVHFAKPVLGLHEVDGTTDNNIVMPGIIGGCSIWIDPHAPSQHRYKNQAKVYPAHKFRMHSSPDGLRWDLYAKIDPGRGGFDTQSIVFWDPSVERYVLYTRRWVEPSGQPKAARYRTVRRLESDNLVDWDNENVVMEADATDLATHETPTPQPPVDYYGAIVFRYEEAEDVYIMLAQAFWHWKERDARGLGPSTFDVRLAVSRDGKSFQRTAGREPFMATGKAGAFDSRFVWAMPQPIRRGDELWIYYVGSNQDHDRVIDPAANGKHLTGIGRAVLRLDGFVSLDAGYEGGDFTTPPMRFAGNRLELNVATSGGGSMRVELLDEDYHPLPGYSGEDATRLYGNSVRFPVRWRDTSDVSSLSKQPVRLRVRMQDCKLYAFQFTSDD